MILLTWNPSDWTSTDWLSFGLAFGIPVVAALLAVVAMMWR